MVNKHQAIGAVVGFLFPLPAAIVGGLMLAKGKKKKTKDYGKGALAGGVAGIAFVTVALPYMPYKLAALPI